MFPLESCTKNHKKQLHWIPTALETVQLLSKIIEIQFGAAPHKQPWFIPSVPGGVTFIKIEAEQILFVRELLIPNSEYVGYKHKLIASGNGFIKDDDHNYGAEEILDDEIKTSFIQYTERSAN